MKKLLLILFFCLIIFGGIAHFTYKNDIPSGPGGRIMVLSVSSDGKYAISTDISRHAVLWNLDKHTYRVLPLYPVNIYSAYFIKHTHNFMFQNDKTNEVIVENTVGKIVKKLNPGFPTYGEIMASNLKNYFASDEYFNTYQIRNGKKQQILYYYCGPNFHKPAPPKGKPFVCMSFGGAGKMLTLTLSFKDKYLIGAGSGAVHIWNAETGEMIRTLNENEGQTYATISPDDKYLLSGDEGYNAFIFDLQTGKKVFKPDTAWNKDLGISFNDIYGPETNGFMGRVSTIKFISNNEYLMFFHYPQQFDYVALYKLFAKKAISYLPLLYKSNNLHPVSSSYVRDQAIDTSPTAHILVMAQQNNNGILVYHFNPKTQTLKQVWAPVIKRPWHQFW